MPPPAKNISNPKKRRRSPISQTMRRWFLFSALGIIGVFGFLGFFGKSGVLDILRLKGLLSEINSENKILELKQQELHEEIARLRDPVYLEFLAREQLGLMRSNEIFILLEPSPSH
jgi:cell division protein FtsB